MQIRLAPFIKWVCIACFGVFVVQQLLDRFAGTNFLYVFGLVPQAFLGHFYIWQVFTFPFFHTDVLHLFFNLMMLAFIGSDLEFEWGKGRLIAFHLICSVFVGLAYVVAQVIAGGGGMLTPLVGVSGTVYGLLVAYGMIFGERTMLFMMIFPLKAKHFVWVLATMELLTSLSSARSGLASIAHVAGMAVGFLFVTAIRSRPGQFKVADALKFSGRKKTSARSTHLKLVINKKKGDAEDDDSKPRTWH